MLELDSDKSIEQIDPVVRIHHRIITELSTKNNWLALTAYFGDEDLLGFKILEYPLKNGQLSFSFSGLMKIEKYSYSIEISQKLNN